MVNLRPTRKSEKCSCAHVKARASFSIWKFCCSVGVSEPELYETGFISPFGCCCTTMLRRSFLVSDRIRRVLGTVVRVTLIACGSPHTHALSFLSRSLRCLVISASWLPMLRNLRTPPTFVGAGNSWATLTFTGSGRIPVWLTIWSHGRLFFRSLSKYSVFHCEFSSWHSKPQLPSLVGAAQARKDMNLSACTYDLRSENSALLEDRRRAPTELKRKFTSAVYKAVLGVEKGHRYLYLAL